MATPTTLPATFVAGNVLQAAQLNDLRGAFRVLTLSTVSDTTNITTSSTTLVDLTGASITVTPQSTSNKILILMTFTAAHTTAAAVYIQMVRASTNLFEEVPCSIAQNLVVNPSVSFLDSPNTTSATTYKIQWRTNTGTVTMQNFVYTVMEISA